MKITRNRSEGWKHAKNSGHKNEEAVKEKLNDDKKFKKLFESKFNYGSIVGIEIGGIREKNVPSILDRSTKSKTDMTISWASGNTTNISIKKSESGQTYLIRTNYFIDAFEKQFKATIPENVKKSLEFFFGEDPTSVKKAIEKYPHNNPDIRAYEVRKCRLTWDTLKKLDKKYDTDLLDWIRNNIENICLLCFSTGQAINKNDHAEYLWYINELEDELSIDDLYKIQDIAKNCKKNKSKIAPGTQGGGTTISLPFGFVQWHQGQMQFHHQLKKIQEISKPL